MPLPDEQKIIRQVGKLSVFLNKTYKILRAMIFVLVIVVGYLIFIQPKFASIQDQQKTMLGEQGGELKGLKQYSKELQELQLTFDSYKKTQAQNLEKLSQILPTGAAVPNLMAQLEAVAQASGFNITSFSATEGLIARGLKSEETGVEISSGLASLKEQKETASLPQLDESIHVLNIVLMVSGGDYLEFKKLLNNLEKHIRLLDINSISFSSEGGKATYNLSLRAYYYEST